MMKFVLTGLLTFERRYISSVIYMQFPFASSNYLQYAHLFGNLWRMNERQRFNFDDNSFTR